MLAQSDATGWRRGLANASAEPAGSTDVRLGAVPQAERESMPIQAMGPELCLRTTADKASILGALLAAMSAISGTEGRGRA